MSGEDNYRGRAMQEHSELHRKIEALKKFILGDKFDGLPEVDRNDLREQLQHMEAYFKVLSRRVSRMAGSA